MIALALLALAAAEPASADQAGNRMVPFAALQATIPDPATNEDERRGAVHCTLERNRCASLVHDEEQRAWVLHLFDAERLIPFDVTLSLPDEEDVRYTLWPEMVRLADNGALLGVVATRSTMYSGGGATASTLTLYRLDSNGDDLTSVGTLPEGGSVMIRACFSEKDMKHRAGACHDEYEFATTLTIDPSVTSGPPRLLFTSQARSFPGHVSRNDDSLAKPPLRRKDAVWWTDPVCSYRRVWTLDPATHAYKPDRSEPDCSDYLEP